MRSSDRPDPATLERYANLINNRQSAKFPAQTPAQELLTQLDYHGITLLAGRAGKLEPELARLIDQRKTMMVANELLKQRALTELFSTLSTSGLDRIILFKGTALAYSVYPEPWLRPRSDVDCLIDHPQLDQFEDVLTTLGYQKQFAIEGKYLSYQTTFSKALSGQSTIHLDLHWRGKHWRTHSMLANFCRTHRLSPHLIRRLKYRVRLTACSSLRCIDWVIIMAKNGLRGYMISIC